ncbi:hypothetical protein MHH81_20545 [Psychrobacillus sp. FSL H8-0484]|uniref:hypothetical protein n=1 Tax=Psychrobacillus sp. FSL H8-0484 TaxID=2921390 RepID=UPI0030FADAE1
MKKIYEKLRTAEGWTKLNILFRLLIFILFITTIGQLFFEKEVTLWEVVKNGFSGTYVIGQYIIYGFYVIAKMLVIIVPTIGAALLIRLINYKDTLSVKAYRIASTGGIFTAVVIWVVLLFVGYIYKITIEENYLFFDALNNWEAIFQLYEYMLPALALTFIDNTFTEIRSAKKIKQRKKLSQVVENEIVEIFSEGNLTTAEQLHLLRNLKKQTNKHLKNKH